MRNSSLISGANTTIRAAGRSRLPPAEARTDSCLGRLREAALSGSGPVVVIGLPGSGKTALCRSLESCLRDVAYTAIVSGPITSEVDLIERVVKGFGLPPLDVADGDDGEAGRQRAQNLHRFLAGLSSVGARAVAIVDDAHALTEDVLTIIADLASLEAQGRPLLQFVFVGQPELRDRLRTPDLAALNRRVAVRCQLEAARPALRQPPSPAPRGGVSLVAAAIVVLLGSVMGAGLVALAYERLGF